MIVLGLSFALVTGCGEKPKHEFTESHAAVYVTDEIVKVAPNIAITTQGLKRIEVDYLEGEELYQYQMLLGAHPGTSETAACTYHMSIPTFEVTLGWAYMAGRKPMGETPHVSAETDGTTIVVQTRADGVERIYLLNRNIWVTEKADVKIKGSTSEPTKMRISKANGHLFIECRQPYNQLDGPHKVADHEDARNFIRYVMRRAGFSHVTDAQVE
jgi:hypothetical protein